MTNLSDTLKAGIVEYTGREVTDLKTFHDPVVDDTYALRATMAGKGPRTIDFLIVGSHSGVAGGCRSMTAEQVACNLEEQRYQTWPPTVGKPKFIW